MAAEQQEPRLPCQRCLRRLSRPGDLDQDECLSCDKQVGRVLCDYCSKGRKGCVAVSLRVLLSAWFSHVWQVPASCKEKARHLVRLYELFCDDETPDTRMAVLDVAKELDKLMTASKKKAEARIGGFASGASPAARAVVGGVTLNDVNNNLRLIVDALRRLAEVGALAVSVSFPCTAHG